MGDWWGLDGGLIGGALGLLGWTFMCWWSLWRDRRGHLCGIVTQIVAGVVGEIVAGDRRRGIDGGSLVDSG